MGTRHIQTVINKKGEVKLCQYCQWDGYPEKAGIKILEFLRGADLGKYSEAIDNLNDSGEDFWDYIRREDVGREVGWKIHQKILDGKVKQVVLSIPADTMHVAEYVIHFSWGVFITKDANGNVLSVPLDNLPSNDEYLEHIANAKIIVE